MCKGEETSFRAPAVANLIVVQAGGDVEVGRGRTQNRGLKPYGLSTLATIIVAQFGDCRQNRRLLPNSATVAVFGDSRRFRRQIVAEIDDYSLQCGQAFRVLAPLL